MASPGNQHCANCIGTLSFLREMSNRSNFQLPTGFVLVG